MKNPINIKPQYYIHNINKKFDFKNDSNLQLLGTIKNIKKINHKYVKKISQKYLLLICYFFFILIFFLILIQVIKRLIYDNNNYINHYNFSFVELKFNKSKNNRIDQNNSSYTNSSKEITIKYLDFWPGFDPKMFYIHGIMSKRYKVKILYDNNTQIKPDYIIYSCFGNSYKKYNCTKIYYTYENTVPDFNECHYSIGLRFLSHPDKRYFRNPINLNYYIEMGNLYNISVSMGFNITNRKFCAWLISNGSCKTRNEFYEMLSKYKIIDSGGGFNNNIGFKVRKKMNFFKNYKFAIVFENSKYLGYCTEKLTDALKSGAIPIYWGDDSILDIFNDKSYIHIRNESEFEEKIKYIIKIDRNDTLYNEIIHEKIIVNESKANNMKQFKYFLYSIFDQK